MKRILFIGDSITESGKFEDDERLGNGYVRMIHDFLQVSYPKRNFEVINKGISGNRIPDLAARWDEDVISLRPDLLSVSIGVNDVWRQLDRKHIEQVDPVMFEKVYEEILTKTVEQTDAQLVLMEPTVIEEDPQSEGNQLLKPYVEIVHKMAGKFSAILVPTHQEMLNYMDRGGTYDLTTDGVHMNSAGDLLKAKTWIKEVEPVISK